MQRYRYLELPDPFADLAILKAAGWGQTPILLVSQSSDDLPISFSFSRIPLTDQLQLTTQPLNNSGMPQFAAPPSQLPGQFQSLLDNPKIRTPNVPWTLSKQEKKDYDQIFRAWDVSGEGFINGEMAREVFGQSGLGQNDLIKIWYVHLFQCVACGRKG